MVRLGIALLALLVLTLGMTQGAHAVSGRSLSLKVYPDGYIYVTQVVMVDPSASSVVVPLVSGIVSNLVATDQAGSPLSYGFNKGGTNITVYTLGATSVSLNYDTNALTAKNGSVWTLKFTTTYNSTVTFPQFSTLLAASGTPYSTPYSINDTNSTPELYVAPGTWTVSYAVPLGSITTSTESPQEGGVPGLTLVQSEELALAAVAVAGAGFYFLWWRRRRLGPVSRDLRPDDVQVLNFIQEKGGKALELEIRTRFALPKTSAWRQIKRLERLGYVKVTKVGSQNQIEIQKREKAEP